MKNIILFTAFLFFLSGCNSAKYIYNFVDELALWQLDSYFELTNEQEDWVEERLQIHLKWHRAEELPHYKRFLTDIQNSAKDGLTMSELDEGLSRFEGKQRRTIERLIPDAALFLTKLSPEQINNLESKMAEENEEMLEKIEIKHERLQERRKDFLQQMEDWFGEFSPVQLAQIELWQTEWFPENYDPFANRMEHRLKSQTKLLALLRAKPEKSQVEEWFRLWTQNWGRDDFSERKTRIMRNKKRILQVDNFITNEQRLQAIAELDDWAEIIEEIMADH